AGRRELLSALRRDPRLRRRQGRREATRPVLVTVKSRVIAAGEQCVAAERIARPVVIVDGDLVRAGGMADEVELAIAALPKKVCDAVEIEDAVADPLVRHAAVDAATPRRCPH